uniref:Uncharacterized protein n=1 Tax=Fundulus heteroclitus TaxID=8078 RepID=A0A146SRH3_FUNHE
MQKLLSVTYAKLHKKNSLRLSATVFCVSCTLNTLKSVYSGTKPYTCFFYIFHLEKKHKPK